MPTLALIGGGHIHTPNFIERLNKRSDMSVKLVWDHDSERAKQCANELQAVTATDLNTIWSDTEIEAVIICSETNRHTALVEAAATAKKHMFVEKPLAIKAKDAYTMAHLIEQTGVIFQIGYHKRGISPHLFIREQIQKGNLGKITRIRHSNCHSGSLRDLFTPQWLWMTDPKQSGMGGFGDLGTHSLDLLLLWMGDIERVTASIDVALNRYDGCDEYGEALIKFANGTVATLAAGWVDVANSVTALVSGTEGHIHVVDKEVFFKSEHVAGADGKSPWSDLPTAWPHAFELFLDAIGGKENVHLVSPHEAAVRSAVMEALYQASEQQAWIHPLVSQ